MSIFVPRSFFVLPQISPLEPLAFSPKLGLRFLCVVVFAYIFRYDNFFETCFFEKNFYYGIIANLILSIFVTGSFIVSPLEPLAFSPKLGLRFLCVVVLAYIFRYDNFFETCYFEKNFYYRIIANLILSIFVPGSFFVRPQISLLVPLAFSPKLGLRFLCVVVFAYIFRYDNFFETCFFEKNFYYRIIAN